LPGENEAGHARAGEPFNTSGDVLSPTPLRVQYLPHILMDVANSDRPISVLVPPDRKQVGERLPATVTLFSLTHARNRILTA
jgi:hypothetical protein